MNAGAEMEKGTLLYQSTSLSVVVNHPYDALLPDILKGFWCVHDD
jgi:hypothetical protein